MKTNYSNLEVYHLAYQFVLDLYPYIDRFPKSEHKNLVLQMKRSAVSMPLNIAEGSSRGTDRQFLPFLSYAFGSARELEVSLKLSMDLGFLEENIHQELNEKLQKFISKLVSLMRYLEKNVPGKNVNMARISRGENPWKLQGKSETR